MAREPKRKIRKIELAAIQCKSNGLNEYRLTIKFKAFGNDDDPILSVSKDDYSVEIKLANQDSNPLGKSFHFQLPKTSNAKEAGYFELTSEYSPIEESLISDFKAERVKGVLVIQAVDGSERFDTYPCPIMVDYPVTESPHKPIRVSSTEELPMDENTKQLFEKFRKQLCEEQKEGKPWCEPEQPNKLTFFSVELCDAVVDVDTDQPLLGFLKADLDHQRVTDVEKIKKLGILFKVTQCGQVDLGYDIGFDTMPIPQYKALLDGENSGKILWSLPNEKVKELINKFGKFGGIKLVPAIQQTDSGGKPILNKKGEKLFQYYDPVELMFADSNKGGDSQLLLRNGLRAVKDLFENGTAKVSLQRINADDTKHFTKSLWDAIKNRVPDFKLFDSLMDDVLGNNNQRGSISTGNTGLNRTRQMRSGEIRGFVTRRSEPLHPLPFTNIQAYRLLKSATQAYLWAVNNTYTNQLASYTDSYNPNIGDEAFTPYIQNILGRLDEWRDDFLVNNPPPTDNRHNFFGVDHLPSIELIWSYWVEQGMLVQTMNSVSLRFQNITNNAGTDPLSQLDIDPLRPLANLFWGYIQDEQHTLTIKRRAYEYDHTYGLSLQGRAVPTFKSVDSRSKFLEAYHNLLHSASIYFKESDDTTRVADAFTVLNNLREVHLLLAEGNHNAYGNLTWTARQEMMIQQYLLARPEMREFLGGRIMVPYREPWMDRVDRMRQIQNWGSTSITHYFDLAQNGEVLLLTIRAHDWSNEEDSNVAGSWVTTFRDSIQRYIHSYRTVTGVDLSADAQLTEASFMQPSILIQRRVQGEQRSPLRNSRIVGANQQR